MEVLREHSELTMRTIALRPAAQVFTGLTILFIAMIFPGSPACTGMALIALGATSLAIERYGSSPTRTPLLLANLLVYGTIYLLFVGATLDAAARRAGELSTISQLDLAFSVLLMTSFVVSLATGIRRSLSTEY